MDKITIHIRRYVADLDFIGGKMVEKNARSKANYTETKSMMNVAPEDISTERNKFIEKIGSSIYNRNRSAEIKAERNKARTIEKLVVFKIE